MTLKAIDARIVAFKDQAKAILDEAHNIGVLIIEHAIEHGDCSRAQHLVNAMPKALDRKAMIDWFSAFTPIVCRLSDDWNAKMMKEGVDKKFIPFNLEGAKAEPWYQFSVDREEKSYDFQAILEMVARLSKTIDKKISDGKVAADDIASAKAVSIALSGLKVARVNVVVPDTNSGQNENDKPLTNLEDAA